MDKRSKLKSTKSSLAHFLIKMDMLIRDLRDLIRHADLLQQTVHLKLLDGSWGVCG